MKKVVFFLILVCFCLTNSQALLKFPQAVQVAEAQKQYQRLSQIMSVPIDSLWSKFSSKDSTLVLNYIPEYPDTSLHTAIQNLAEDYQRQSYPTFVVLPLEKYPHNDPILNTIKCLEYRYLYNALMAVSLDSLQIAKQNLSSYYQYACLRDKVVYSYYYDRREELRLGVPAYMAYRIMERDEGEIPALSNLINDLNSLQTDSLLCFDLSPAVFAKYTGLIKLKIMDYLGINWRKHYQRNFSALILNDVIKQQDYIKTPGKAEKDSLTKTTEFLQVLNCSKKAQTKYEVDFGATDSGIKTYKNKTINIKFDDVPERISQPAENEYVLNQRVISGNYQYYSLENRQLNAIVQDYPLSYYRSNQRYIYEIPLPDSCVLIYTDSLSTPRFLTAFPDSLQFKTLYIKSHNFLLQCYKPGFISTDSLRVNITLNDIRPFHQEEEYLQKLDELYAKLTALKVPQDWFIKAVESDSFKYHYTMPNNFYNMAEHQVGREDTSFEWYMNRLGVKEKALKAVPFKEKYLKELEKAEKKNGMHYEIILGILGMETNYAESLYKGSHYVSNALISQYLFTPRREKFAVTQLTELYKFTKKTGKPNYSFIGSYAGACGWGQFIPSSLNSFFIDSQNNDQDIDIYSVEDNIASIENYLFQSGLSKSNMNDYDARFKAVYSYNHSDAYVKAVLYIYDEMRKIRK